MSSVKSKSYILLQIKTILEKKGKSDEEIEEFIEANKDNKVYELLVLKKTLQNSEGEEDQDYITISENVLRNRF